MTIKRMDNSGIVAGLRQMRVEIAMLRARAEHFGGGALRHGAPARCN